MCCSCPHYLWFPDQFISQAELDTRGILYSDIFEKSEYVNRLAQARKDNVNNKAGDREASEPQKVNENHSKQEDASNSAWNEIEKMSLSAIRKELSDLKVSTQGAFEKRVKNENDLCNFPSMHAQYVSS
jgi:hypothetical protein